MSTSFTHDATNSRSSSVDPADHINPAHMVALADVIEQMMADGPHDDGAHLGRTDLLACVTALRLTASAKNAMVI